MLDAKDPGTLDLDTGRLFLGYARVSTEAQDLSDQREQLQKAGCTKIFAEKISGRTAERPKLKELLGYVRKNDLIVVTRLDRLARSTKDLLSITEQITSEGADVQSLAEPWLNTTTPAGRMVLTVFSGIAEFERQLIAERTRSGRQYAMQRGVKFGRKPILSKEQMVLAKDLLEKGRTFKEVASLLGCHRSTLYRNIEKR